MTTHENSRQISRRILFQWNGHAQDVHTICQKEGVSYGAVLYHVKQGMDIGDAVRHAKRHDLHYAGEGEVGEYGVKMKEKHGKGVEKLPVRKGKSDTADRIKGEGKLRKRLEWCRKNGVTYRGTDRKSTRLNSSH